MCAIPLKVNRYGIYGGVNLEIVRGNFSLDRASAMLES